MATPDIITFYNVFIVPNYCNSMIRPSLVKLAHTILINDDMDSKSSELPHSSDHELPRGHSSVT